jgi:hypothetical protein
MTKKQQDPPTILNPRLLRLTLGPKTLILEPQELFLYLKGNEGLEKELLIL